MKNHKSRAIILIKDTSNEIKIFRFGRNKFLRTYIKSSMFSNIRLFKYACKNSIFPPFYNTESNQIVFDSLEKIR